MISRSDGMTSTNSYHWRLCDDSVNCASLKCLFIIIISVLLTYFTDWVTECDPNPLALPAIENQGVRCDFQQFHFSVIFGVSRQSRLTIHTRAVNNGFI